LTQSPAPNLSPPGLARNLEPDAVQLRAKAPNRCRHAERSTLSPYRAHTWLAPVPAERPPSFGASPKFGPAYRFSTIFVRKLRSKRCDGHHFGGPSPLYTLKSSSIRNRSGGASKFGSEATRTVPPLK